MVSVEPSKTVMRKMDEKFKKKKNLVVVLRRIAINNV